MRIAVISPEHLDLSEVFSPFPSEGRGLGPNAVDLRHSFMGAYSIEAFIY